MPLKDMHGCPRCREIPATNEDLPFERVRRLFDRNHEDFSLMRCRVCSQPYLFQFHEIVDWTGRWGMDQMWCYWMPLTEDEFQELDTSFAGREATRDELGTLIGFMGRRGRLIQNADGKFYWSDVPFAAGDLLPPG